MSYPVRDASQPSRSLGQHAWRGLNRRITVRRAWKVSRRALYYLVVLLVTLIVLFPFYIAFDTSIKPAEEARQVPRSFLTTHPILKNYTDALFRRNLVHHLWVTTLVGLGTTGLGVTMGSLAAFSLSRFRFKGREFYSRTVLMVYMFPPMLLVVPLFLLFAQLRMNDSLLALIITDTTFSLPFSIWMLKAFFDTVPRELDEAALIDGCTPFSALFRIVLPISAPGLVATAVFCFMLAWGEYLFAFTLINSQQLQPITVAIYSLIGPYNLEPGVLMAASIISALAPVVFFLAAQRWIVQGLTAGAIKG